MKLSQIRKALKNGTPLVWNDPDPIDGNDYNIKEIHNIPSPVDCNDEDGDDCVLLIIYGDGSEAEVYPYEISLK